MSRELVSIKTINPNTPFRETQAGTVPLTLIIPMHISICYVNLLLHIQFLK